MTNLTEMALRRNARDGQSDLPLFAYWPPQKTPPLTLGGREIQRRTNWSVSLCNAVAAAWAFGSVEC